MTKFMLILWVCSFVGKGGACLPPMEYPAYFNSWYECSRMAHKESVKVLSKLGYSYVNEHEIGLKYNCRKVPTT
jgi:hypothetical protein